MKFKAIIATVQAVFLMTSTAYAAIGLTINNEPLQTDVPPTVISGRTLVPVRTIFESLGATVEWNDVSKTVTAQLGETNIILTLDSVTAVVNGEQKTLDVSAQTVDGRTMVPARFVAESMGCDVTWNKDTQTVSIITRPKEEIKPESPTTNTTETKTGRTVYVTKTGAKYHYDNSCNSGTYFESTIEDALVRRLEPCNKCAQ